MNVKSKASESRKQRVFSEMINSSAWLVHMGATEDEAEKRGQVDEHMLNSVGNRESLRVFEQGSVIAGAGF